MKEKVKENYPSVSLTSKTMKGMGWMFANIGVTKISGLIAQIALGWLLSKEDFALYALAISAGALVGVLRNGGTQQILIQKGQEYEKIAATILGVASVFNLIAMVLLFLVAPVIAEVYDLPMLTTMLRVIAVSFPISTLGMLFKSKLLIDLNFARMSKIDATSSIIRNLSLIGFAIAGFGPISFVLPYIVCAVFEAITYGLTVGKMPTGWLLFNWQSFYKVVFDSKWVMLSAFANALIMQGDYLIIGLLEQPEILAIYFFGFQLTVAISRLYIGAIETVMLPSFAKLSKDVQKQGRAFVKSISLLSLVVATVSMCIFIIAKPFVHIIWSGKWDDSAVIIQILVLTSFMSTSGSIARSLFEARGLWKKRFLIFLLDAIGILLASALGAYVGGALSIAISISVYRISFDLWVLTSAANNMNLSRQIIIKQIMGPFIVAFGCGTTGVYFSSFFFIQDQQVRKGLLALAIYISLVVPIELALFTDRWREIGSLIKGMLTKKTVTSSITT
jgi:PST family polysaccharide transporter